MHRWSCHPKLDRFTGKIPIPEMTEKRMGNGEEWEWETTFKS